MGMMDLLGLDMDQVQKQAEGFLQGVKAIESSLVEIKGKLSVQDESINTLAATVVALEDRITYLTDVITGDKHDGQGTGCTD